MKGQENSPAPDPTHDNGESIACPFCNETWSDLWDYDWGSTECLETECPHCDAHITLCANFSVDYTCYPGWQSEEKECILLFQQQK
ncbi:MAG: hypothetical protein ACXAC5_03330 [Promethearchaeota archaeon]|jgi:hypothetical protein